MNVGPNKNTRNSESLLKRAFFSWLILLFSITTSMTHATEVLPRPDTVYEGRLGLTPEESDAQWPELFTPREGLPNILVIMTDDEGFGTSSAWGGPIPRPTLEKLADSGLRYNNFHTEALCSPARAALLRGRKPHAVNTGVPVEMVTPYPGYWMVPPRSAVSIARVLRDNGYNTAMFGKDHNVPGWERSANGPFDNWPNGPGQGFEYFFGFVGADVDQWHPNLFRNTVRVSDLALPEGETLDYLLASDAIEWIHQQKAGHQGKPFFIYYAPGTPHAPHQAPQSWIEAFEGRFDAGWDKVRKQTFARQKAMGVIPQNSQLSERPEQIAAWDSLSRREQVVTAKAMEVYAATVAYQDAQIGRIVAELERIGELDNTLIVFITGDNGGSTDGGNLGFLNEPGFMVNDVIDTVDQLYDNLGDMGGPRTYQNYASGWAWAMSAPFPWAKQVASHLGALRNGLVVSWPTGIADQGGLRGQYSSVTDIYPTLLEITGIRQPTTVDGIDQDPVYGVSLAGTFADPNAPELRETDHFETLGNRAVYHRGWWANTVPERAPWETHLIEKGIDEYDWELYHLTEDFTQAVNLADQYPEKLEQMQALWLSEAQKHQVLPVDYRFGIPRGMEMAAWLQSAISNTEYSYWRKGLQIELSSAPPFAYRSFRLEAEIEVDEATAQGVIAAIGSWFGGWSFYLDEGRPVFHYARSIHPQDNTRIAADRRVPLGERIRVAVEMVYDEPGLYSPAGVALYVNDELVADGRVPKTVMVWGGIVETFDIGMDSGSPVVDGFEFTGLFPGHIEKVRVQLLPPGASRQ